jgi:ribonuclease VapC
VIFHASTVLALLLAEPGKDRVAQALLDDAMMTTVNFAEVATKYVLRGAKAWPRRRGNGCPVTLVPVDADLALRAPG